MHGAAPGVRVVLAHRHRARPRPAADAQALEHLPQALVVLGGGFLAAAHAGAALHLVCHAGAVAPRLGADAARAQLVEQRQLAQGVVGFLPGAEGAVDGIPVGRVGPVEGLAQQHRAALPGGVVTQPEHGLGLAQLAVLGGLAFLDEARLQQQRAQLARRGQPFDAAHLLGELGLLGAGMVGREVAHHPRTQADALADVDGQFVLAVEEIHAGAFGQALEHALGQPHRPAGGLHGLGDGEAEHLGRKFVGHDAGKLEQRLGVAHRPVAGRAGEVVAGDQRVQPVAVVLGVERAGQLDGAQHRGVEALADARELVLDEAVVEARVVGHEHAVGEQRPHAVGEIGKGRGVGHHGVGDAGEALDGRRNRHARVDQARPALDQHAVFDAQDRDLGDPIHHGVGAGGFNVDEGDLGGEHGRMWEQGRKTASENTPARRGHATRVGQERKRLGAAGPPGPGGGRRRGLFGGVGVGLVGHLARGVFGLGLHVLGLVPPQGAALLLLFALFRMLLHPFAHELGVLGFVDCH